MLTNVFIIVPVLNSAGHLRTLLPSIGEQGIPKKNVLFIDSASDDNSVSIIRKNGYACVSIARESFNHGATRQLAVETLSNAEFFVFLTQDAILAEQGAVAKLIASFLDPTIGVAYGRQLPRHGANAIESFARLRNYPEGSEVRDMSHRKYLGIKTIFSSNSFAAYRKSHLDEVGGFPVTSFAEDQIVAARILISGKRIAYVAEAAVYHSHGYSIWQDYLRYKLIGEFHKENLWILQAFGRAEGEGFKFVKEELLYLLRVNPVLIPSALVRTAAKYAGYRLGLRHGVRKALRSPH